MISKQDESLVSTTQQKWANIVLEIGKAHKKKLDLDQLIFELLNNIYAFNYCDVLFKPTLAKQNQFRTTKKNLYHIFLVRIKYVKKTVGLQLKIGNR